MPRSRGWTPHPRGPPAPLVPIGTSAFREALRHHQCGPALAVPRRPGQGPGGGKALPLPVPRGDPRPCCGRPRRPAAARLPVVDRASCPTPRRDGGLGLPLPGIAYSGQDECGRRDLAVQGVRPRSSSPPPSTTRLPRPAARGDPCRSAAMPRASRAGPRGRHREPDLGASGSWSCTATAAHRALRPGAGAGWDAGQRPRSWRRRRSRRQQRRTRGRPRGSRSGTEWRPAPSGGRCRGGAKIDTTGRVGREFRLIRAVSPWRLLSCPSRCSTTPPDAMGSSGKPGPQRY